MNKFRSLLLIAVLMIIQAGPLWAADAKLSALPAVGGAPAGTDILYIVNGGVSKKVTTTNLGLGITDENFTTADHSKLDGIEASATANQSNAEIKTAYEANADTNAFTDAEQAKLSGVETGATGDQTDEEIQDIAGPLVATGGTKTRIAVTYQDVTADMDFVVDDMNQTECASSSCGLNTATTAVDEAYNATTWNGNNEIATKNAIRDKIEAISGLPVADTTSIAEGSADATKEVRFEVDGVTTGTVRVLTVPDKDITIADNADVTNKLPLAGGTMSGNITMSGAETVDGRDLSVDGTKLDAVEASADVTDTTNVAAAGAIMDSDISEGSGFLRKTGAGAYEGVTPTSFDSNGAILANEIDDTMIDWGTGASQVAAADIPMAIVAGATYTTVQEMQDIFHSTGWVSGGGVTDDTDGTITVAAGAGLIRATNSAVAEILFTDWAAEAGVNVALVDGSINYVYVEYNAGSPQVIATTTERTDFHTNILLATIDRDGTTLHINEADKHIVGDHAGNMIRRFKELQPYGRVSGGVISETGTRNFALTAGAFWRVLTKFSTAAFDSSVASTFSYFYDDGASGWTEVTTQTAIDNTQYDDASGTLATLSNNKYGAHWVYLKVDGNVVVLYGKGDYTLTEAENAQPPATTPQQITVEGFIAGKIIIQKSASVFTQTESAFQTTFTGSIAQDHGGLTGLADDDHTQYGHLAQAETITENWVNTANPWADNEVVDTITASNYLPLAGGTLTGELVVDITGIEGQPTDTITDCASFAATGGGLFYDDSEGVWKKCQDNVLSVMDTTGGTPATADISDVSVTQTELAELETIGATTISANQWTALGGIAETLTFTELNLLDGITVLSGSNTGDNDEVGTKTAGDLCINDGSVVNCTVNTEAELETALDAINVIVSTELDTSLKLLGLLTDETGTGAAVFGTAPTFTTSITMGAAGISEAELEILDGATATTTELNKLASIGVIAEAGKKTLWIPAAAMRPTKSNGAAALVDVETTAGRPDMSVLDFDATADEHAQFQAAFPKSWNLGTVTYQAFWTSTAADTDGVSWGLQGVCMGDNSTIDVVYGTAIVVDDANQSAAEELLVSAESAAVTFAGTPADDDLCYARVFRDVSDANDTATEDARLLGIKFFYTTDAANDE